MMETIIVIGKIIGVVVLSLLVMWFCMVVTRLFSPKKNLLHPFMNDKDYVRERLPQPFPKGDYTAAAFSVKGHKELLLHMVKRSNREMAEESKHFWK